MKPNLFLVAVMVCFVCLAVEAVQTGRTFVLEFKLDTPSVVLHEPIFVSVTAHNSLQEAVLGGINKENFEFVITNPQKRVARVRGLSPAATQYVQPDGDNDVIRQLSLLPNQTTRLKLLLNESYPFPTPGSYTVQIRSMNSLKTASGRPVKPTDIGEVIVRVEPRNEVRLRSVCSDLAKTALTSGTFEEKVQAALALSYVQDSVAIPYLKQLFEQSMTTRKYSLNGLTRIGTSEAVDVLAELFRIEKSSKDGRAIEAALRTVEMNTLDQGLKTRIQRLLDN